MHCAHLLLFLSGVSFQLITYTGNNNLNDEQLKKVFILPHTVSFEPYVRAFKYKVLNSILFTNTKLFKIGFVTEDKCSFCKSQSETLSHLLFDCKKTRSLWRDFEFYFYSLSKEFVHLTLKDVIVGIIITKCPLLNYLLLIDIFMGLQKNSNITKYNWLQIKG